MNEITKPTQDERLVAALAHASVILGLFTSGMGGITAALVIWVTQKERSRYVAFQAMQAMVYQGIAMLLGIIGWGCYMCGVVGSLIPFFVNPGAYQDTPPLTFFVSLGIIPLIFLVVGVFILYGLWGALRAFQGRDFRYVIIGHLVERYLE